MALVKTFDFSNFQSGDRVVLIDDVISSGGTLRAICAALFSANVQIAGVHCVYAKCPTTALADELGLPIFALSGEESVQEDSLWPTRPAPKALVAVEGIDGSGKTTQARLLTERFQSRGVDATSRS